MAPSEDSGGAIPLAEGSFPYLDGPHLDGDIAAERSLSNGHSKSGAVEARRLDGHDRIIDSREATLGKRESYRRESELEIQRRESELEDLRNHRHQARMLLAEALGHFGFVYDPQSHEIQRFKLGDPPAPPALDAPPVARERFDPADYGLSTTEPKPLHSPAIRILDGFMWAAVPFLGAFVGYSIGHMAGLHVDASLVYAGLAAAFGIAILVAMKSALFTTMHHASRRAKTEARRSILWLAFAACGVLILCEAGLGMVAVRKYSEDRAVTAEEFLPWWAAALIALCFSTPILLTSVVKGWAEGREHDDRRDEAMAEAKRAHEDLQAARAQHEAEAKARAETAIAEHRAAIEAFEAANAEHRSDPRWQAALGLFTAVSNYSAEIDERKRLLDNFKISRGYGESALRKEA